jgi:hypothetical protein
MPWSETPFFSITSASDRAVPDEPTASSQPSVLEALGDGLHQLARGELGVLHRLLVDLAAGKEARGVAHAAHVEAFHRARLHLLADDAFGRAAADVHHEAVVLHQGQRVRDPEIDEARLLVPGDHLDRESERALRLAHELLRILRDTQRVGADHAHRAPGHSREALGELAQRAQRSLLRVVVEALVGAEACAQAHGLLQRIQRVDLLADHATDGEVEAVGAQVDGAEGVVFWHS